MFLAYYLILSLVPMKLNSPSFPGDNSAPVKSSVHKLISLSRESFPMPQKFVIREFEPRDLQQLKLLQDEWFPIGYSKEFYNRILNKSVYCLIVECTLRISEEQDKDIIVGAVVFELTDSGGYLYSQKWWPSLSTPRNTLYIMTIGVLDEFRKRGIAEKLLLEVKKVPQSHPKIEMIYLHVVSYNLAAINFYTKNGFKQLQKISDYYHIKGKVYEGLALAMFYNGGQPKQSWTVWFRRVILRRKIEQ